MCTPAVATQQYRKNKLKVSSVHMLHYMRCVVTKLAVSVHSSFSPAHPRCMRADVACAGSHVPHLLRPWASSPCCHGRCCAAAGVLQGVCVAAQQNTRQCVHVGASLSTSTEATATRVFRAFGILRMRRSTAEQVCCLSEKPVAEVETHRRQVTRPCCCSCCRALPRVLQRV